MHIVVNW